MTVYPSYGELYLTPRHRQSLTTRLLRRGHTPGRHWSGVYSEDAGGGQHARPTWWHQLTSWVTSWMTVPREVEA